MNEKQIDGLKKLAEPHFKNADPDRWAHSLRVLSIARILQKHEGGDLDVIEAAAILHDTGRGVECINKKLCHAEESSKIADKLLAKINFPKAKINKVKHCIEAHRWSKGLKAETIEAQIIKDADRLEASGAVGVARAFTLGMHRSRPFVSETEFSTLDHIKKKLIKIDADSVGTKTAKKIIKNRNKFVVLFAEEFEKELKGER
ncbi:MAG: HD domain-containing protein [Nanoarchaeota archaeon]|nr:HD domain-containing protein [Nanoarchaeota archaeon]